MDSLARAPDVEKRFLQHAIGSRKDSTGAVVPDVSQTLA